MTFSGHRCEKEKNNHCEVDNEQHSTVCGDANHVSLFRLSPAIVKVCCSIEEMTTWMEVIGVVANSVLSPVISVDDIVVAKEVGKGSYVDEVDVDGDARGGDMSESSHFLSDSAKCIKALSKVDSF